jgi:transcriptional regulator with XRE-family HTH domain
MSIDADRLHRALGAQIRSLREGTDDSQEDLADALGLSRTSVVNIEAGRQRSPLVTLYRIAKRYGVDVTTLLPPMSEVDDGQVEERLIEEAVGRESPSRDAIASFVQEVKSTYKPRPR